MDQRSVTLNGPRRFRFQYVACVGGLAIAVAALVALGSLRADSAPASKTAARPAPAWQDVEVPTIVVYLADSEQQAEKIRAMENELDYFWNESLESRPPRSFQIFVADTQAGEDAANRTIAELFEVATNPSQLRLDVFDLRR